MARKKTSAELEEAVREMEARLAKAKEQLRLQSKAEEAHTNAEIIRALHDFHSALPSNERPDWSNMPEYIRSRIGTIRDESKKAGSQLINMDS